MPDQPTNRRRLPPLGFTPGRRSAFAAAPPRTGIAARVGAALKLAGVVLWTLGAIPVQALLLVLPGRMYVPFARTYWHGVYRLLGLRVRVVGQPAGGGARPLQGRRGSGGVLYAVNHCSWLDITVLGGTITACFVSKDEVGRWPLVGTVARLGRTVFVSRRAAATGRERNAMRARLGADDSLILFPEGTSSDGSRVLPFRSTFFAVAEGASAPLVQPVSLVYDRLAGLPTGRASRPYFAWYGDMDLGSHAWRFAQLRGLRATLLFHAPLDPASFPNRKAMAQACWQAVADGAAQLRQNRQAEPIAVTLAAPVPAQPGEVVLDDSALEAASQPVPAAAGATATPQPA